MESASLASTPSFDLTNVEFYNFVTEQTSRIFGLGTLLTDADLKILLSECSGQSDMLQTTQNRVMKSLKSIQLPILDHGRDVCYAAVKSEIRNARYSVNPDEKQAALGLTVLIDSYGDVSSLHYKVESTTLDKFLEDIAGPTYKPLADKLTLQPKLVRLRDSNDAFKTLFSSRQNDMIGADELKAIEQRKVLNKTYQMLCDFVLLKAQISPSEQYSKSLHIINSIRQEYTNMVATKVGVKKANQPDKTKKGTPESFNYEGM